MKKLLLTLNLILILCVDGINAVEYTDVTSHDKLGQPLFTLQTIRRLEESDGKARVDFYVEVMNDLLQFVRDNSEFKASAELNLDITTTKGLQVARKTKFITKTVISYQHTNLRDEVTTGSFSLFLSPGEYIAKVMLIDEESKRKEFVEQNLMVESDFLINEQGIIINDSTVQFNLSDLILTRSTQLENDEKIPMHPLIGGKLSSDDSKVYIYFDVYRQEPLQICKLILTVFDRDGRSSYQDSLTVIGGEPVASYFMPIDAQSFKSGRYKAILRGEYLGINVVRNVQISINSFGLPSIVQDLDQAIQQLRYIATREELRNLTEAFQSDREKEFVDFWDKHFPSPGEAVNGKMIEYYHRVKYANDNFGNIRSGWETDRGQVIIIYGKPSEIERHDFDSQGAPYEIWYYHNIGKRFLFRDDYGFGDYRLVGPIW